VLKSASRANRSLARLAEIHKEDISLPKSPSSGCFAPPTGLFGAGGPGSSLSESFGPITAVDGI
jgi:hypothetical protein